MGVARTATIALLVTGAAVTTHPTAGVASSTSLQTRAASSRFVGVSPRIVATHAATLRRHRDPSAALSLNLGLAVHRSGELDAVIRAASTPGSEAYGRYLDHEQYMARFAPAAAEVAAARSWVTGKGMHVTGVSADNLILSVATTTAAAERAFAVTVNEYSDGERTFFANDIAPSVPADSSVRWVTGLDNYTVARSFVEPSFRSGGYFPSDFQKGYNTGSATSAQSIGFTLWGAPLVQSDLTQFATHTGSPPVVVNGVGASGIDFIPCTNSACTPGGTQSTDKSVWIETALDVEAAHGVAPGSHMKYWLAHTTSTQPDLGALENAVNAAANDSTVRVVSNSWGVSADTWDPNIDASLQHAAAVGKTFFFSSGDTAEISYPATSPYVVSVGGTNLALDGTFAYSGETAWGGSGTGCSAHFARPSWQIGVGAATCSGRAEPDVAADADAATGAYVYYNGGAAQVGGTSLSAPLWAGMTAVWNQANSDASRPLVGFAAPLLYEFGNNPSVYNQVFHDVTSGSAGGNPAGPGWDQVTGWGSPNLANLIAQHQGLVETLTTIAASKNPTPLGTTVVFTATVSPVPNGGTITFRQNGKTVSGCSAKALTSGAHATCSIAYSQATTYKVQASYSGNATYAGDASSVLYEKVAPAPTPSSGYWMVNRTGAVFAFGAADWRGNASTQNVSHFEPTPSHNGYWIVNRAGQVFAFGNARVLGGVPALAGGESVSSLSSTPTGHGYWLFTSKGRAITYGDAHFYGDMRGVALNGPVIGSVATPSGHGYFMVASDGGIFSFGDAGFFGSTGRLRLNKPVNGLVPTATNRGYWMVASDGGIFAFGDADFRGSMGGRALNAPVVGMVRYGNGYLMVASDGGIFNFSNAPFRGSLGDRTLDQPIVSVAS